MTALASLEPLARFRDRFPIFRHATYLNSCSLGALSEGTRAALTDYLEQWERRGAAAWYESWLPACQRLRAAYGRVVGAEAETVALQPCISSALAVVAESLDYRERPKVVTTSLDFPTVAYQWLAKRAAGVEVEILESPDGITVPLELFERAVDGRTALIATSHVFFATGAIQDVRKLAELAHRQGAHLLIDGYHAAGQVAVDVGELEADYYLAGGLKWLLGGSGIAFLYVRASLIPRLEPRIAGWFGHAAPFRFDPRALERAADARRFELGTPAMASVYAQLAGLEVLEEAGFEAVQARTRTLAEDLIAEADARGCRPRVAPEPSARSAIVMLPRENPAGDVARLAEAGFIVDARPGHVRLSPYFYNVAEEHRALLERLVSG